MKEKPIVEMRQISKTFGSVLANDKIDFNIRAGEIHALLGENGAGKTTLMKILFGLYRPDNGEILIKNKRFESLSPAISVAHGMSMVHQHFKLVEPFLQL